MNSLVSIIFIVVLVTFVSSQNYPSTSRQLRRRHKKEQKVKKTGVDCTLVLSETQFEDREEEEQWECYIEPSAIDSRVGGHYIDVNVNFGADYKDEKVGVVESGYTRLTSENAIISQSKAVLVEPPTLSKSPVADGRRRLSAITGERKVLIVRVKANDSVTSSSKAVLAREILGVESDDGETDGFNLATGFRDCSYNKLTFVPTDYSKAKNGVYTVKINTNVVNKKFTEVRNIVLDQLRSDFSMNNLNNVFDHVMICMPPGTVSNNGNNKWAAYGIVNGYVTVFNDNWCTSVSAQMQ